MQQISERVLDGKNLESRFSCVSPLNCHVSGKGSPAAKPVVGDSKSPPGAVHRLDGNGLSGTGDLGLEPRQR